MMSGWTNLSILFPLFKLLSSSLLSSGGVDAAFASNNNNESPSPAFTLSDRFKSICPADISSIHRFDPYLVNNNNNEEEDGGSSWVAIYRSNNNLPSVLIKDDFLNAMKIATTVQGSDSYSTNTSIRSKTSSSDIQTTISSNTDIDSLTTTTEFNKDNNKDGSGVQALTPVAVAKLSPSSDFPGRWTMESMRCSLKKEDSNNSCDGGSEHTEALSICIDELILHHLKMGRRFDGAIRTKATLVSGTLLEERGFREVTKLSKDMATHLSSVDACMEKYAERVVTTLAKSPGARDRALEIVSYLGQLDSKAEKKETATEEKEEEDGDSDYDPWAPMKRFL